MAQARVLGLMFIHRWLFGQSRRDSQRIVELADLFLLPRRPTFLGTLLGRGRIRR